MTLTQKKNAGQIFAEMLIYFGCLFVDRVACVRLEQILNARKLTVCRLVFVNVGCFFDGILVFPIRHTSSQFSGKSSQFLRICYLLGWIERKLAGNHRRQSVIEHLISNGSLALSHEAALWFIANWQINGMKGKTTAKKYWRKNLHVFPLFLMRETRQKVFKAYGELPSNSRPATLLSQPLDLRCIQARHGNEQNEKQNPTATTKQCCNKTFSAVSLSISFGLAWSGSEPAIIINSDCIIA